MNLHFQRILNDMEKYSQNNDIKNVQDANQHSVIPILFFKKSL